MPIITDEWSTERRTERSSWASEALYHQLKRVATQYDLEAVVLTDRLGHLWAASNTDPMTSGLVAHLNSQGLLNPDRDISTSKRGRCSVVVKTFQVGPATLFLAAQETELRSGPEETELRSGPAGAKLRSGPEETELRSGPEETELRSGPAGAKRRSGPALRHAVGGVERILGGLVSSTHRE